MEQLKISGGKSLFGTIEIPSAKNSVLPIIAACVLCSGAVTLEHVPMLEDVRTSIEILRALGCGVEQKGDTVTINAGGVSRSLVPPSLMSRMRSSVFYLAPLLSRTGHAEISRPGGCNLGARPIDIHLAGLAAMGAFITARGDTVIAEASNGLHGADFTLRFPSVGATETLLMAAVLAKGNTILRGAATEPEVCDLAKFLTEAGAKITGAGTRTLRITGQENLFGARFKACPDRITAATVMCAVAACGGEVLLENVRISAVKPVVDILSRAGCSFSLSGGSSAVIASNGALRCFGSVTTGVYPAFPTDAAPLVAAALLKMRGTCSITDMIFQNRFSCASQFTKLGANVNVRENTLDIKGVNHLIGAKVEAQDLRGGAALVIAAMTATGDSTVSGVQHIARGYQDIVSMFFSLGADISLCSDL